MATVDESLSQLGQSKIFSKLDANSGFWQINLCSESRKLTTFLTPFARYAFNRFPFGIPSEPEIISRTMMRVLAGISGVIYYMDDILVYGKDDESHDTALKAVLTRLQTSGLTLKKKCEFNKSSLTFVGPVMVGVKPYSNKVKAIRDLPGPICKSNLK